MGFSSLNQMSLSGLCRFLRVAEEKLHQGSRLANLQGMFLKL